MHQGGSGTLNTEFETSWNMDISDRIGKNWNI